MIWSFLGVLWINHHVITCAPAYRLMGLVINVFIYRQKIKSGVYISDQGHSHFSVQAVISLYDVLGVWKDFRMIGLFISKLLTSK